MIRTRHPVALVVTLLLIVAAVGVLDPGLLGLSAGTETDAVERVSPAAEPPAETRPFRQGADLTDESGRILAERLYNGTPERIDRKRAQYDRAREIRDPTGFINAGSLNLSQYVGQRVILIEFWTFGCYNCQNTHPHIQDYWRTYEDDGLLVVGIHYPEFDYEREPANVREYVTETNTTYPVVIDNDRGTWGAYDQRAWPTRYLVGVDGFVRYKHVGEGRYDETDRKIGELLAERDRVVSERRAAAAANATAAAR